LAGSSVGPCLQPLLKLHTNSAEALSPEHRELATARVVAAEGEVTSRAPVSNPVLLREPPAA